MKIDNQTLVPLHWVVAGFAAGFAPVIYAAFWISSVNYRLERIEDKLGIPVYRAENEGVEGCDYDIIQGLFPALSGSVSSCRYPKIKSD